MGKGRPLITQQIRHMNRNARRPKAVCVQYLFSSAYNMFIKISYTFRLITGKDPLVTLGEDKR